MKLLIMKFASVEALQQCIWPNENLGLLLPRAYISVWHAYNISLSKTIYPLSTDGAILISSIPDTHFGGRGSSLRQISRVRKLGFHN